MHLLKLSSCLVSFFFYFFLGSVPWSTQKNQVRDEGLLPQRLEEALMPGWALFPCSWRLEGQDAPGHLLLNGSLRKSISSSGEEGKRKEKN